MHGHAQLLNEMPRRKAVTRHQKDTASGPAAPDMPATYYVRAA